MSGVAYMVVASGKPVDSSEVERTDAEVVDVTFSWGEPGNRTVLAVKHLSAGEGLVVGEDDTSDLLVPEAILGATHAAIVTREGGKVVVHAPFAAQLSLDGRAIDARSIELSKGQKAEVKLGLFSLRLSVTPAAKKIASSLGESLKSGALKTIAGSALVHTALFASVALFMPAMGADDVENNDRDRIEMMSRMLSASAERELEQQKNDGTPSAPSSNDTLSGEPAGGSEGKLGKPVPNDTRGKMSSKGDGKPDALSRDEQIKQAGDFGIIGILAATNGGDSNQVMIWGLPEQGGGEKDSLSMFMDGIGDANGTGLYLSGNDEGGGRRGLWIGMDGFGSLPNGMSTCTAYGNCGKDGKLGNGRAVIPGSYKPKQVSMRPDGVPVTNGRMPPEVIQRIVRQNDGRFRMCYETGLRANPSLEGRVEVRFMIDRAGRVAYAAGGGSLPDANVQQCVASSFNSMSFPEPKDGTVTVTYGFAFSPS